VIEGIDDIVARAEAAHPDVRVERAAFEAFLARKLGETPLGELHTDDLYLVAGCVAQLPSAIRAFDRACTPVIDRAVSASGATGAEIADLRQVVRARLLVATAGATVEADAPPRIASYSGKGSLGSWVRVIATREAARLLARERREAHADDDDLAGMVAPDDDPEVGYLKRLYRAEFKAAFARAIAELTDRERMLLRQHALDSLSIDELAAFYKVHRATTARWLEAARQALLDGTRTQLIAALQLTRAELDSVMRLIGSNLAVSLPKLLRTKP